MQHAVRRREDIRHYPLESTWLPARIPFQTVKPIIGPEMNDKKGEKLLEEMVSHATGVMDLRTHDTGEYSPEQIGCWGSVAHELQCQHSAGWTESASLIQGKVWATLLRVQEYLQSIPLRQHPPPLWDVIGNGSLRPFYT